MKRVAVFLDGSNYFYTQKKMGWQIDVEKLLNYCKGYGEVVEAVYYTGKDTSSCNAQNKYLNKLAYIGYSLVTKPVKTIYDHDTGKSIQKANLDVEIAVDMYNMIDRYDMAILISGDGDFERALQLIKSRGKEIKVLSTRGVVATELVHIAGVNYIDFQDIKETIKRGEAHDRNLVLGNTKSIVDCVYDMGKKVDFRDYLNAYRNPYPIYYIADAICKEMPRESTKYKEIKAYIDNKLEMKRGCTYNVIVRIVWDAIRYTYPGRGWDELSVLFKSMKQKTNAEEQK